MELTSVRGTVATVRLVAVNLVEEPRGISSLLLPEQFARTLCCLVTVVWPQEYSVHWFSRKHIVKLIDRKINCEMTSYFFDVPLLRPVLLKYCWSSSGSRNRSNQCPHQMAVGSLNEPGLEVNLDTRPNNCITAPRRCTASE